MEREVSKLFGEEKAGKRGKQNRVSNPRLKRVLPEALHYSTLLSTYIAVLLLKNLKVMT